MTKIYLIAGEASGDLIGQHLIHAIKRQAPDCHFMGIGGPLMESTGLQSLFPMHELSVMGLIEIIPHLFHLKLRINQTVEHICKTRPDVLVTIDAPGFCFRVIKRLKKRGLKIPCIHYVAPSVWAWKPKRAKKVAGFLDHLLTLFPFEPSYFTPHGLATTFVGHPLVEIPDPLPAETVAESVLLLPGSRFSEVKRHWPIFVDVMRQLLALDSSLNFHVVTLPHLEPYLKGAVPHTLPLTFHAHNQHRFNIFAKCQVALAASGTVSLELAKAHVPMVITYKVPWLTFQVLKRLVKSPYVCLVNILLQQGIVPELLQQKCTSEALTESIYHLLKDPAAQKPFLEKAFALLRPSSLRPSDMAATIVLSYLRE